MKYKDDIKKKQEIIKEINGKTKMMNNNLPEKGIANSKIFLTKKKIANQFKKLFCKNWSKAGRKNTIIQLCF